MRLKHAVLVLVGCLVWGATGTALAEQANARGKDRSKPLETATVAGGCFWCMQPPFDELTGVVSTTVGYTGGTKVNPTYEEVCSGATGHTESIQVVYDPTTVSYEQVLDVFWHNIDPTTPNRQFADEGRQYRTAIFSHTEEQHRLALESKAKLERSGRYGGKPIVTEIVPASTFYPAEGYHQQYYKKNPIRYKLYRFGSGRDQYLQRIWGR